MKCHLHSVSCLGFWFLLAVMIRSVIPMGICPQSHFECGDSTCIPRTWTCDMERDCMDGSDEATSLCCTGFICGSGECLRKSQRCNGVLECDDMSDEKGQNCCASEEADLFECVSTGLCVPSFTTCDGNLDCAEGEDEANCPVKTCAEGEILCRKTGRCVNDMYLCDGDNDCGDFTDEMNCLQPGFYSCSLGPAVFINQTCDGIADCKDGSDELGCVGCELYEYRCPKVDDQTNCVSIFDLCNEVRDCPVSGADEELGICVVQCRSKEFMCTTSGVCLPNNLICDGVENCDDGSDEASCDCAEDQFKCTSGVIWTLDPGLCIDKSWRCDGMKDCNENEDETGCDEEQGKECEPAEYKCKESNECISYAQVCDGFVNCPLHEDDESSCVDICPIGLIPMCHTTTDQMQAQCLETSQICDGWFDCDNGMDEEKALCDMCYSGLKCGDICLNFDEVCDGVVNCPDALDEMSCPLKCLPQVIETDRLIEDILRLEQNIKVLYNLIETFPMNIMEIEYEWSKLFAVDPFDEVLKVAAVDASEPLKLAVISAQDLQIHTVKIRGVFIRFINLMNELGFTDELLPERMFNFTVDRSTLMTQLMKGPIHADKKNSLHMLGETVESVSDLKYTDMSDRIAYVKNKIWDCSEDLGSLTFVLRMEFAACDEDFATELDKATGITKKSSFRDIINLLTLLGDDLDNEDKMLDLVRTLRDLKMNLNVLIRTVIACDENIRELGQSLSELAHIQPAGNALTRRRMLFQKRSVERPSKKSLDELKAFTRTRSSRLVHMKEKMKRILKSES